VWDAAVPATPLGPRPFRGANLSEKSSWFPLYRGSLNPDPLVAVQVVLDQLLIDL